jgi:hypothetical protein
MYCATIHSLLFIKNIENLLKFYLFINLLILSKNNVLIKLVKIEK